MARPKIAVMKKLILIFVLALFAGNLSATTSETLIGTWKYTVVSAPVEYSKGEIVFRNKDGKMAGEVKFTDGTKVELRNIEFKDNLLKFGVYIESDYIQVSIKVEGKKMSGTVQTPEGPTPVEALKQ